MLSRKNFNKRVRQMDEKKERFSIRKLSVGAASVVIGLAFFGMSNGQSVKADVQEPAVANQEVNAADNSQDLKQDAKDETAKKSDLATNEISSQVTNTDSTSNNSNIQAAEEWQKTGQTMENTRTIRYWFQYTIPDAGTYTYSYRKGTPATGTINEKVLKVTFDEYKNTVTGATQWRVNKDKSSNFEDLLKKESFEYIPGYALGITYHYDDKIVPDSKFDDALKQNNGKESGSDISKILGTNYTPYEGNEHAYKEFYNKDFQGTLLNPAFLAEKDGIYNSTPKVGNQSWDVIYFANLQNIRTSIIDQDTNKVIWQTGSFFVPSDWTWFQGATAQLPKGYHEGTKKGNPIPNLDFKTGKFIVDGKVVNGVTLPVGTEDINFVYYVQKDAEPTEPETPVTPEVPVQPVEPTEPTQPSEPVLPETNDEENNSDNNTENLKPHATKPEKRLAKSNKTGSTKAYPVKLASKNSDTKVKAELPQTGEEKSEVGIFGLAFAGLATLLGLAGAKKREH